MPEPGHRGCCLISPVGTCAHAMVWRHACPYLSECGIHLSSVPVARLLQIDFPAFLARTGRRLMRIAYVCGVIIVDSLWVLPS